MNQIHIGTYLVTLPDQIIKLVYNHDGFHEFQYPVIDLTKKTYQRLFKKDISNIQLILGNQQRSKININILDTVRWYRPTTLMIWTANNNKNIAKQHIIEVANRLYRKNLLPVCRGCQHLTMHKYCPAYGTNEYCSGKIFKEIYVQY